VKSLRDGDEKGVSNLLSTIRSGASLAEINVFLTECSKSSEPRQTSETQNNGNADKGKSDSRHNCLDIDKLLA
jgi:hypothetical protein